jgi:hypothetical protein
MAPCPAVYYTHLLKNLPIRLEDISTKSQEFSLGGYQRSHISIILA